MLSSLQQSRLAFFCHSSSFIGTLAGMADYLGRELFPFSDFFRPLSLSDRRTLQSYCVRDIAYLPEILHAYLLMAESPIYMWIYVGEVRVNGRKQ